jgi:hypothetical protein
VALGVVVQDHLAGDCRLELQPPDNGFDCALSAEPHPSSALGAGIAVALVVVIGGNEFLDMRGLRGEQGHHGGNI